MVDPFARFIHLEYEVYNPQTKPATLLEKLQARKAQDQPSEKERFLVRLGQLREQRETQANQPFPPAKPGEVRKWISILYRTNCGDCLAFLEIGREAYWIKREEKTYVFCPLCAEKRGAPKAKGGLWR